MLQISNPIHSVQAPGLPVALLFVFVVAVACDRTPKRSAEVETSDSRPAPSEVPSATPVAPPPLPLSKRVPPFRAPGGPEQLVIAWNAALSKGELSTLERLYADDVLFYGVKKSRKAVVEAKRVALAKQQGFRQVLQRTEIRRDRKYHVATFTKLSGTPPQMQTVKGQLTIEGNGPAARIVGETDAPTQEQIERQDPKHCGRITFEVVDQLPEILAAIKDAAENHPHVSPGGLVYEADRHNIYASLGFHHPDRYESRFWVSVVNGDVNVRTAASMRRVSVTAKDRARIMKACKGPPSNLGAQCQRHCSDSLSVIVEKRVYLMLKHLVAV